MPKADPQTSEPQTAMDAPYCEICGEALATVQLEECAACDECDASDVIEATHNDR